MMICLKQLRSDDGIEQLKTALEIYVNDPVIDWLKYCKPSNKIQSQSNSNNINSINNNFNSILTSTKEGILWEPRRRIDNALKKLNGLHPVILMMDELQCNVHISSNKAVMGSLYKILQENRKININENYLSCNDQVIALIDLATDPNILSRQFIGLSTWV